MSDDTQTCKRSTLREAAAFGLIWVAVYAGLESVETIARLMVRGI